MNATIRILGLLVSSAAAWVIQKAFAANVLPAKQQQEQKKEKEQEPEQEQPKQQEAEAEGVYKYKTFAEVPLPLKIRAMRSTGLSYREIAWCCGMKPETVRAIAIDPAFGEQTVEELVYLSGLGLKKWHSVLTMASPETPIPAPAPAPRKNRKVTNELKQKVLDLSKRGYTDKRIAEVLDVGVWHVAEIVRWNIGHRKQGRGIPDNSASISKKALCFGKQNGSFFLKSKMEGKLFYLNKIKYYNIEKKVSLFFFTKNIGTKAIIVNPKGTRSNEITTSLSLKSLESKKIVKTLGNQGLGFYRADYAFLNHSTEFIITIYNEKLS